MARNAKHIESTEGDPQTAQAGLASDQPTLAAPQQEGAPRGQPGPLVATLRGTMPAEQAGLPAREAPPVPEHDVYAKDGMLSTDPRARAVEPLPVKQLEWTDGKVIGKALHVESGPTPKQWRVAQEGRYIAPGGVPVLLRVGKVVSEGTHNVPAMRQQGIKLEEIV